MRDARRIVSVVTAMLALVSCASHPAASAQGQPFRFVQLRDPQLGFGGYEHDRNSFRKAVTQINALKPDFVIICGDLVDRFDEPSLAEFARIKAGLDVPCCCAAGNHDVGGEPTTNSPQYDRKAVEKDYYAEPTSKNFDGRPLGFRLWHIGGPGPFRHEFVPLAGFP